VARRAPEAARRWRRWKCCMDVFSRMAHGCFGAFLTSPLPRPLSLCKHPA
jgi:hypothetical protein